MMRVNLNIVLTLKNHGQLKSLDKALSGFVIELKVLFANISFNLTQLELVVFHVFDTSLGLLLFLLTIIKLLSDHLTKCHAF